MITISTIKIRVSSLVKRTVLKNDNQPQQIDTRNDQAIALLTKWLNEGDTSEQQATWAYLKKHLDEDRLSNRKLFP